ncbi:ribonuclease catalytic domain-containing protein [Deltaproteobacteria bacterium]|nr:ribonuclease catalytic domain-containing protein [Deltaproteobacteria bacterium]
MTQGKIIEYIDQGKIICTFCLQDKGNRLHLLTPFNRQINLAPKRALFISSSTIDSLSPREEVLTKLRQVELLRGSLKREIHVRDLWELIRGEDESFDYKYLAQLCFGETVTDDHISALMRALFDDKLYFKMKDGRFIPHSQEKVEQIIRQREEETRKQEKLEKGSAWLKEVLQGEEVRSYSDYGEIIKIIVELALHGKEAPNHRYGKELLSRAGISDIAEARKLLVKLGVWEEDEPLDLLRLNIRKSLTDEQINESYRLNSIETDMSGREDLRDLSVFTIDGPMTKDFDDALSVEIHNDYIRIGVHIADVAMVIDTDSILDMEACLRGSSLYLPRHNIHMFPTELSNDRLSLIKGVDRPAISLLASFDKTGNLSDYRFVPSIINVREQLTYNIVNEKYESEDRFSWIYRLCEKMHQKRVEQGALILSLPEASIHVGDDSSVSIEMISQESPSRMMVAELMILYNWLAARLCRDNNIPIIYRGQKKPIERLAIEETGYVYYVFRQRQKLSPLVIDIEPTPHAGLGLDLYSNLTSPIRRYFDLVSQRQMRNYLLKGTPLYNKEELEKIRVTVIPSLKDLITVRRNRVRYWIQKYFGEHVGDEFPAIILDVMKSKYRVILENYLFVAEMKREPGQDLFPGQKIMIRIKKADQWEDLLKLEYAGSL